MTTKCDSCRHWVHNGVELACTVCGFPKSSEDNTDGFSDEEIDKFQKRLVKELSEEQRYAQWKKASSRLQSDSNTQSNNRKDLVASALRLWIMVSALAVTYFAFNLIGINSIDILTQNKKGPETPIVLDGRGDSVVSGIEASRYLDSLNRYDTGWYLDEAIPVTSQVKELDVKAVFLHRTWACALWVFENSDGFTEALESGLIPASLSGNGYDEFGGYLALSAGNPQSGRACWDSAEKALGILP